MARLDRSVPDRLKVIRSNTEMRWIMTRRHPAGQLITWVFILLLAISALFADERTQGTLKRLLTTPTTSATFLVGTISGQVVMALVQMLLLVGFASW
jgi:ABC-2 type transport system permease protein